MSNTKSRPNIVLFMIDTQRADHLSCYGRPGPTSPHIDRLAAEGALFLDNISPAIWTLPSSASMMTGLHVHSHGAGAHNDTFDEKHTTIAETLGRLGYRSAGFYANRYCQMTGKGFQETHRPPDGHYTIDEQHELSRQRIREAKKWVAGGETDASAPFFLFVQVMEPHLPLHPPKEFRHFVLPDATEEEIAGLNQNSFDVWAGRLQHSPRDYALLRSLLDGETAFADSLVGDLADHLREQGLLDDTLFVVTSDHGDMLGEKRFFDICDHYTHHLCLYEPVIHTPLIVRYPRAFPAGTRVAHSTQTLDLFPTLAELIGFDAPFCQGWSLLSALGAAPKRPFTLSEYMKSVHIAARMLTRYDQDMDVRPYLRWLKAFRKGGMKYIWASDGRDELYDLRADPAEQRNLIDAAPDKAREMRVEMERFLTTLPCGWRGDKVATGKPSPESLAKLRGLEFFHEVQ